MRANALRPLMTEAKRTTKAPITAFKAAAGEDRWRARMIVAGVLGNGHGSQHPALA